MSASIPHHYCSSAEFPLCEDPSSHVLNGTFPLLSYDINSPVSVASFPDQQLGVSDCMVVPQMSEMEAAGFRDFSVCDYHHVFEPGEEYCSGLLPTFWSPYNPIAADNWAIQGKAGTKMEEGEVKVGRYSVEERKDRIMRYLKKRNQRNFNKTIKYACRKTLADKRIRVRGRFAKNNEPSEEEASANANNHDYNEHSINSFYHDSLQMKYEEDSWLQAAMDNLVHFPYLGS